MRTGEFDLVQKSHLVVQIQRGTKKESLEYTPKLFVKWEIQSYCAGSYLQTANFPDDDFSQQFVCLYFDKL